MHVSELNLRLGLRTCIDHTHDDIFTVLCSFEESRLLWWLVMVKAKEVPAPSCVRFMKSVGLHSDNFREFYIQNMLLSSCGHASRYYTYDS